MLTHLAALSQEELVKDFAATWKSGIELINTELVSGFPYASNFSLIVPLRAADEVLFKLPQWDGDSEAGADAVAAVLHALPGIPGPLRLCASYAQSLIYTLSAGHHSQQLGQGATLQQGPSHHGYHPARDQEIQPRVLRCVCGVW